MKVLFIGGTGQISTACARQAMACGIEVTLLNRGLTSKRAIPEGARVLHADVRHADAVRAALGSEAFDVVANFVAFTPEHVQTDLELFSGHVGQYVFISSSRAWAMTRAMSPGPSTRAMSAGRRSMCAAKTARAWS